MSFHALEFSNPLGAGETGSLEFTFFLNTLLPATIGTQSGQIIIECYPQIPQPPSGTVVCFFFENYTAVTCNYDTSDPDKTVITINTPNNIDYYQSEVPIVVTTQGATGTNGIRLPDLVQRYNFYMYFYLNGAATWHEVAYADYVPAARVIPDADFTLTPLVNEANEYTILKIEFTNNYHVLNAQYDFLLTFDHSNNAWEANLGWGAKTVTYQKYDYPCIVENSGTNYYCEIRPGTALGTTSTIAVMYKGNLALGLGTKVVFYFPRIQLGSNPAHNMQGQFKIREYTPGQLANYIDIYTYQFSVSGIIAQDSSTTYTTITSGVYTPLIISAIADVAQSFTCTNGITNVIYEYPAALVTTTSTPTITNCDGAGGTCYVFGGSPNFNWVYYIPSAAIASGTCTTTLTSFTQLYPYSTTISVRVRTFRQDSNGVVDRKILERVLPAGDLTVTPASLEITAVDTTTYLNGLHIMQISFANNYEIPKGGSITVQVNNAAVPTSLQSIATAGLTASTTLGVVIKYASATSFTVTNFDAVAPTTTVTIQCRLLLTDPSPGVRVTTFYTGGQTIDQGGYVTITTPLDLTVPFFQSVGVVSTRPQKLVHVTQDGTYQFTITPSVAGYTGGSFSIKFATGFSVPATTDDPVCIVGSNRRSCSFSATSPVTISFSYNAADWSAGVATSISIYTDYSPNNKKGIIAPTTAGWYQIVYTFTDNLNAIKETNMDYIFIPPADLTKIRVQAAIVTAGAYNMFTVTVQVSVAIPAYSAGGRFYIDFPTGTDNFADDLGTGLSSGDYIGCDVSGSGISTSSSFRCVLATSTVTGQPATVEVINFDAITVTGNDIVVRIAKVKNPSSTANTIFQFFVRMNNFNTATAATTYLQYSTFTLSYVLLSTASPTTAPLPLPPSAEPAFTGSTGQANQPFSIVIYSAVDLDVGDYFVIELPSTIQIVNPLSACPAAATGQCWSFADAGWVVYQLTSAVSALTDSTPGNIESNMFFLFVTDLF